MSEVIQEPSGKKTNIILTYDELSGIHRGVQEIGIKLDQVQRDIIKVGERNDDHEVRIRALELTAARHDGGQSLAQWAGPFLITIGMAILGLLNFLSN